MNACDNNAMSAMPEGPFVKAIALAVGNDDNIEAGQRWLITHAQRYLEANGLPCSALNAFDHMIWDIEALDKTWPAFLKCEALYQAQGLLAEMPSPLPDCARYLAERLPAMWDKPSWVRHAPITSALQIADNIDTMVGFFGVGIRPTGSKDPHALRRAAFRILENVLFPIMREAA